MEEILAPGYAGSLFMFKMSRSANRAIYSESSVGVAHPWIRAVAHSDRWVIEGIRSPTDAGLWIFGNDPFGLETLFFFPSLRDW